MQSATLLRAAELGSCFGETEHIEVLIFADRVSWSYPSESILSVSPYLGYEIYQKTNNKYCTWSILLQKNDLKSPHFLRWPELATQHILIQEKLNINNRKTPMKRTCFHMKAMNEQEKSWRTMNSHAKQWTSTFLFPRASERRVLLIVGSVICVCHTSSHLHIFMSSHLHIHLHILHLGIITSSHLTSSHTHIFTLTSSHTLFTSTQFHTYIFTSSHLHILTSSHSQLHIFTYSHLHTRMFTSSHLHYSHLHTLFTSSHLSILTSLHSHLHIWAYSHLHTHIFTSSHLSILTSFSFSLSLSLSPLSLSLSFFCLFPSFSFSL